MRRPRVDPGEDCFRPMDPPSPLGAHPYATIVTAVFLVSLLVTALYGLGVLPGPRTQSEFDRLLVITGVLFLATAASWIAALGLTSIDE